MQQPLVLDTRENAVSGLSPHCITYAAVNSHAPTTDALNTIEQEHKDLLLDIAAARNIKLLWVAMGRDDHPRIEQIPALLALFDKYGIEYTYHETQGAHQPWVWRENLYEFAQLLFRDHSRPPR